MTASARHSIAAQRGFTLIELVLVMLIIALASVPLFTLFTQASSSLLLNENLQTAAQLAQERAETLLADRRNLGFDAVLPGNSTQNLTGNFSGFSRITEVRQPLIPPAGCPAGATCREVVVSVAKDGATLAEVNLVLVDY